MESLSFKLECFEGPLDLLLTLVGKKKIEVWDIHISEILEQYMEYLQKMRELDMEITADFLAMASNLVYIKSRMLLPHLLEADEEDPRAELARSLQEYQNAKQGAEKLAKQYAEAGNTFVREPVLKKAVMAEPEDGEFQVTALCSAFLAVFERNKRRMPPPITSFSGIVGREPAPVIDQIRGIIHSLKRYGMMKFSSLFRKLHNRSEIVATFLAVLELSKDDRIKISDVGDDGTFLNSTVEIQRKMTEEQA